MKWRHIAVEILPRALWIIMVICLYMFQHFANEPPILTENIPMLSFGIHIMLTGIGLLFFSHLWFAVMLVIVLIWYPDGRIEEEQMIDLHGSVYFDYRERTGMFIPKI